MYTSSITFWPGIPPSPMLRAGRLRPPRSPRMGLPNPRAATPRPNKPSPKPPSHFWKSGGPLKAQKLMRGGQKNEIFGNFFGKKGRATTTPELAPGGDVSPSKAPHKHPENCCCVVHPAFGPGSSVRCHNYAVNSDKEIKKIEGDTSSPNVAMMHSIGRGEKLTTKIWIPTNSSSSFNADAANWNSAAFF